jgi:hypothetical protein
MTMAGFAASRVGAVRSTAVIVRVRIRLRIHPAASPHRRARQVDSPRRRRAARQVGTTARQVDTAATAAHQMATAAHLVGTAAHPLVMAAHLLVMAVHLLVMAVRLVVMAARQPGPAVRRRCRRNRTPRRRAPTPPRPSRSRSSAPRCGAGRMCRRTPSHRPARRTGHDRLHQAALYRHRHPGGCGPTGSNPAWNRRRCRSGRRPRSTEVIKGRMAAGHHRVATPPQRRAHRPDHGSAGPPAAAPLSQRMPSPPVRRSRSAFRSPGSI